MGCATADNRYVIVAGGHDGSNYLRSTEILDLTKPNPSWTSGKKSNLEKGFVCVFHISLLISGPDLPTAVEGISIIQSGNGILAIGGRYHDDEVDVWYTLKSIHSLSCNETECQWTKKGELNHARSYFSVFPIRPTGSRRITSGSRRITFLQPMLAMISLVISWF